MEGEKADEMAEGCHPNSDYPISRTDDAPLGDSRRCWILTDAFSDGISEISGPGSGRCPKSGGVIRSLDGQDVGP